MTLQELEWYAHGFFLRAAKDQEGLRRVWLAIHNSHFKEQIVGINAVHAAWPLYHDPVTELINMHTAQYQAERFQEFKALRDANRRTSNSTDQSGK